MGRCKGVLFDPQEDKRWFEGNRRTVLQTWMGCMCYRLCSVTWKMVHVPPLWGSFLPLVIRGGVELIPVENKRCSPFRLILPPSGLNGIWREIITHIFLNSLQSLSYDNRGFLIHMTRSLYRSPNHWWWKGQEIILHIYKKKREYKWFLFFIYEIRLFHLCSRLRF